LTRVAARLAPVLATVCDCRDAPDSAVGLCGTAIKIETMAELQASTNGRRIRITTGMLQFLRTDDELAFVLAHEVSHVLLGHTGAFDESAPRSAEAEADRLGIQLVSKAGFDTEIAARLPERLAQANPRMNGRPSAYGPPAERAARIGAALAEGSGRPLYADLRGKCASRGTASAS
jgi:Zn-dependent protease with chaperone function